MISVRHNRNDTTVETPALIDSGAGGTFIDQNYVWKVRYKLMELETLVKTYNVDGTENKKGMIKNYVDLQFSINRKDLQEWFYVTGLGKQKVILGLPWLRKHNLEINWQTGKLEWQTWSNLKRFFIFKKKEETPKSNPPPTMMEEVDEEEFMNRMINILDTNEEYVLETIQEYHQGIWINKTNMATELAMAENLKKKTLPLKEMIPKEFHEYLDIFNEQKANRFPMSRPWDHRIEMKEGFEPKSFKNYSLTPQEQIKMEKFLKENLEKGYIWPSKSPMASPFFFVDKKDGKLQPTQDYWYLNEWTIKNAYPLPLISDVIDKLQGSRYFTKLDIRWGYNNVRIKEGDEWKAAFKTNKGLFKPMVMFFGLCNSPATFQNMMDHTFSKMIAQGFLIIYMDDLLIHAENKEDLKQYTKQVLQRLWENDMYCKPQKCEFKKEQTEYLGMVISHNSVSMDPTKLTGIKNWPTPMTIKQVRSFLGFGNYYWRFIKKFAHLARPLNNLLKKDAVFDWTKECQASFDLLKKWFSEEPILMMPNQTKPFQIETDTSKYASGAILTQTDMNGDRHPIAFLSKTFTETEWNYDVYDRELLAIIWALTEWRHYIQGSGHTTEVLSDHMNLMYFKSTQKLNRRQAQWALLLSEYDLKLWHVPRSRMTQADTLSRRSDHYQK